ASHDASDNMIEFLLTSHKSYVDEVQQLVDAEIGVKALAHITGGGLFENVPRVLPEGLGAAFDLDSWSVPDHFRQLVEWGELTDDEAFRVWNMGVGMVVVAGVSDLDRIQAGPHQVIGEIVANTSGDRVSLRGDWR
ncbi:MAG: AIR synthase-related protein, partial [Acidimicrobiales bacterium]